MAASGCRYTATPHRATVCHTEKQSAYREQLRCND